jgi:pyruvate dehydrogenase E2 component (dihydrolipoamide acetyltransferase)
MAEIVTMPKLGFDMAEGTLVRWVIAEGEQVAKGAVLAEIETDKATVEVESNYEGVVTRHLVPEGDVVPVNTPIAVVGEPDEQIDYGELLGEAEPEKEAAPEEPRKPAEEKKAPMQKAAPAKEAAPGDGHLPGGLRASPLARRMAEERGIDLSRVEGSGPGGRVVKADIEAFREAAPAAAQPAPQAAPLVVGEARETRRLPLSRLRAAIGRRMVESTNEAPHFYVTHEYDVAALLDLRKQVNAMLPEESKTSVNDYIVKAVALTLREFPNLNASLDEENKEVIQHGQINIGVAVAVENGLLTVVCKDTDRKNLTQISKEVRTMAARAREGKVRSDDIEGSTFSISNLGMFDVENFSAIINPPEAAILAVGSARAVPVVEDGELKPGMRMKATISIDHRVSDGAEAARFMQAMAKYLEKPMLMLV